MGIDSRSRGAATVLAALGMGIALGSCAAGGGGIGDEVPELSEDGRYIVTFIDLALAEPALAAAGAEVALELPTEIAVAAYIDDEAVLALARHPAVVYIEPDPRRYPLAQTTPYGIPMVQALDVEAPPAANRTICIIDSGYDAKHEDLSPGFGATANPGTGDPRVDGCGHGTHVAGTIAALTNTTGVVGVHGSGAIGIHIVKVFDDACGWTYSSNLIAAARACADAGANVISMSLGCGGSCRSEAEATAFADLARQGILSVAAAGNGGGTGFSYPASYDSVISVGAVDRARALGSFSQRNAQVELVAPGVAVQSTVPRGTGMRNELVVGGDTYEAIPMTGTFLGSGAGALVDCGFGTSACAGAAGRLCLIRRGSNSFADKVRSCEAGGGRGAIIQNYDPGDLIGSLGGVATGIPAVGVAGMVGDALRARLGQYASLIVEVGDYAFFNGTSMATPHVSAVAALVWSHDPRWTSDQIRAAMRATAVDLGPAGRDDAYGHGLVQASAALDYLLELPTCTVTESPESSCGNGRDDDCDGRVDGDDPDCGAGGGPVCGNGVCEGSGEDGLSCPADCRCAGPRCRNANCGDGICRRENARSCPIDCG